MRGLTDMGIVLSSGQGEAAAATVVAAAASLWPDEASCLVSSVSCRRDVSLIYAGWLPQDGTFDSELAAGQEGTEQGGGAG